MYRQSGADPMLLTLVEAWRHRGWALPGASADHLDGVEHALAVRLPLKLRALYQLSDGSVCDDVRFLPSRELGRAAQLGWCDPSAASASHLVFADRMAQAHAYGLAPDGGIDRIDGVAIHRIATSIDQLLARYVEDPSWAFWPEVR